MELSTIALLHGRDPVYERAAGLFTSTELQHLYVALRCMDDALTQPRWIHPPPPRERRPSPPLQIL